MPRKKAEEITSTLKSNSTLIWNVAVYIRLSKEDGNDVSISVIHQKQLIQSYLENSEENFQVVDYYIDDGLTGTDDTRENFQRMIYDIERKKVNCIITKDLSRTFRNYADQGHYLEYYFVLHDIRFISLELPQLDSYLHPETYNSFMVPIQGVVNDNHCRETSIKIREVFKSKRNRGEFIGAFAPYGYQKDKDNKNHLVIDEEVSQVIKDIFQWYLNGMSMRGIAFRLNELGIPNPTLYKKNKGSKYHNTNSETNDGLWCGTSVSSILKNEMYIGNMVQGKFRVLSYKVHKQIRPSKDEWYIIENTHEPIIEKKEFEKVQELLKRNTRTAPIKKEVYPFSGLVYCADCKKAMHRNKAKTQTYYVCRTNKYKSKTACSKHSINEKLLEEIVLKTIQKEIEKVSDLDKIIEQIKQEPSINENEKRISKLLKQKEKEITKNKTNLDSVYFDWKQGNITKEQFQRLREKLEKQNQQLEVVIKKLEKEVDTLQNGITKENPYFQQFEKYKNIKELNRNILITLIDKIYIHENKEITIIFRFQEQNQQLLELIKEKEKKTSLIKKQ